MKKEIFVLGIGRALQVILLFFNYRLLTTVLPKDEVGQYFFILSLSAIVGLIFINPIGTYFNRTLHSFSSSKEVKRQMVLIFFIILFLATLNFPIVFLTRHFFNSLESQW
ncbi:MAG: hypothetical protein KDD34_04310, partial [Bdellovibrionales bacterium]|nr:hypothetical protein [Bdellovibrionales bacterium]